ncbi:hypothetical protein UlMin_039185 [Ulmus minor]
MASKPTQLRVFFLPFLAPGHMIPMVDAARLFARHGVDVTIVTTRTTASYFKKSIDDDKNSGNQIRIHTLQIPSAEVGIKDGVETFLATFLLLRKPMEQLLYETRPDCIVSDMFYPWSVDVAEKLGIPRLVFHGSSYFGHCAEIRLIDYELPDSDVVLVPNFPYKIEILKSQLADWLLSPSMLTYLMKETRISEEKSYGILMNTFQELESSCEEFCRTSLKKKTWSVGPISSWVNRDIAEKVQRFNIDGEGETLEIMNWLDSKERNSVLYVNFGSLNMFGAAQLTEIAYGLEASGHSFIWVVRKEEEDEVFPVGFEERMKESKRGFLVKNWAPQMAILDHQATGGMVTHCGWNSVLEGVAAGLPMITWPLFGEQFLNEKFVTEVLGIGVGVGVKEYKWCSSGEERKEIVKKEKIEKVVALLMGGGEEGLEMKKKVIKLAEEAKKSVGSGGSSQENLKALLNELKLLKIQSAGEKERDESFSQKI